MVGWETNISAVIFSQMWYTTNSHNLRFFVDGGSVLGLVGLFGAVENVERHDYDA